MVLKREQFKTDSGKIQCRNCFFKTGSLSSGFFPVLRFFSGGGKMNLSLSY